MSWRLGVISKSIKLLVYQQKPENNSPVLLKTQPFCANIVDECLWLNMHWVGVKFLSFFLCYELYFAVNFGT